MPVIDDLELPIKRVVIEGPAVDAHENRREENNHPKMTTERLNSSYEAVRDNNLDAIKGLGAQPCG